MTDGLNPSDLELIDYLQLDGRMPFTELARRTGVTEKTVRRRVARLLSSRFITIAAVTDPSALGFDCMALVLITVDGSRRPVHIAEELVALPEVDYVTVTTGEFALQAEVICTDKQELYDIAFGTIGSVAGVASVEVLPYLRLHYQQARHSGAPSEAGGVRPKLLDDTDRAILTELAVDGRASFRDFATRLGVSEATVRQRYAKLVDSGAARVMCIVNPLRLGYRSTSWIGIRIGEKGRAQDVAEALTRLSAVSYVAITAGRFDLIAEVVAKTEEVLLAVVDDQIRTIEGVAAVDIWMYLTLFYKAVRPRRAEGSGGHDNDVHTV
ncbi:AsnC family transcriptional regulator [Mycolicibacterium moriokaense]|uniref:AsnC family transcriptional regulator n=1 Tax=Mycolicibacterium moriokaense TaxID=39691 RepID=A0AAD1H7G7_9MYCO|nr:AsnC family transcriptional regulator [Mycolicibacterium moriokaense]MCV7039066.1 Lrp/AsnC family transcriptional regulator [Mycolicibacterium moriokaense]ORB20348.1 AsnC family transcriptional regulator [Mycolicibacterium moriokaense]BBW99966.1 AsnC family transcriptional regulator [Mycolicibacterium moriokaense]